ncbi:ATP-dependent DNA helicase RecQ-like [Mytilus edulis]|uniref:ATP-dependent DNA helicase RecQ-like n=1 Tax=Mytilus edulis TaxID=6550 RepID=UPI0039F0E86A
MKPELCKKYKHVYDPFFRGEEFRTAFKKLRGLKSFFPNVPVIGLSGTLTVSQKETIPKQLGLEDFHTIEKTPDRPNIFIKKIKKEPGTDVMNEYEQIVHKLCDDLYDKKADFPVTLLFLPVYYMSEAMVYLLSLFDTSTINDSIYSAICSGQDQYVIDATIAELKKENPTIRLVLTSISGMGFDPKNVTSIIHACPPRNTSQYLQEIGRAGRCGQPSVATLYYSNRDLGKNLPGIKDDIINYCKNDSSCIRNQLLSVFGFEKDKSIIDCQCCSFCAENCICESIVDLSKLQNFNV